MYEQVMTTVVDPTAVIENYVKRFNLEEPGVSGLMINYIEHLKFYDSWEEVRLNCLAINCVINKYLQKNVFDQQDFVLIQKFAETVHKYCPMEKEEYKMEVFWMYETMLQASDTAETGDWESPKCFFKAVQYAMEYMWSHPEDAATKTRMSNYMIGLGKMAARQSGNRRIKYGYKTVKLYKELLVESDNPSEWLFSLLCHFGQMAVAENQLEVSKHARVIEEGTTLIHLCMDKIKALETKQAQARLKKTNINEKKMTKRANLWARGVVHLCHLVYALYDDERAQEQYRDMQADFKIAEEKIIAREIAEEKSKILVKVHTKKEKENKGKKVHLTGAQKDAAEKLAKEIVYKRRSLKAPSKKNKLSDVDIKKYVDEQKFGPMLVECEHTLKKLKGCKLPIDKLYLYKMNKLIACLYSWAIDSCNTKVWEKNAQNIAKEAVYSVMKKDDFTVFYKESEYWGLKDEKKVISKG